MLYETNEDDITGDAPASPPPSNRRNESRKLLTQSQDKINISHSYKQQGGDDEEDVTNDGSPEGFPPDDTTSTTKPPSKFIYLHVYFIVIASVLGTGILGLPVKLAHSGFTPFLASYTTCYFMQALVLFYVIELLQRATVILRHTEELAQADSQEDYDSDLISKSSHHKGASHGADLHFMGQQFLGSYTIKIFDLAVLLHLVTILISYGLAGSEAYGHFFGIDYQYLIVPFVVILTSALVFGARYLPSVISLFTFAKGSLLFLVVFVTLIVAGHVKREIQNDWVYIGKSFLIGTVALGGAANVIPVLFAKLEFTKAAMLKMMTAVMAGLTTVYVLNIAWCYYLLRIIPQTGPRPSLQYAEHEGEIAIIPLVDIINQDYPMYNWVATLVDVFIMVSITVSYSTMGTGLKHVLDGFGAAWRKNSRDNQSGNTNNPHTRMGTLMDKVNQTIDGWESSGTKIVYNRENPEDSHTQGRDRGVRAFVLRKCGLDLLSRESILYVFSYGLILAMAVLNPRGFLAIMENGSSLGLNLNAGVFVATMLMTSRSRKYHRYTIPFPMPKYLYALRYVVLFYFTFAVVYDIGLITFKIIAPAIS